MTTLREALGKLPENGTEYIVSKKRDYEHFRGLLEKSVTRESARMNMTFTTCEVRGYLRGLVHAGIISEDEYNELGNYVIRG